MNIRQKNLPANQSKEDFLLLLRDLKIQFDRMQPELEVTLRMPDSDLEGYVVVWNTDICKGGPFDRNGRGAGKGGTRILPDLKLQDVVRLARAMAEKNAAAGLPLGGAKSGLRCNSNAPGYEQKFRSFVAKVQEAGLLFEDGGIFGGFGYDVGGKPPLNAQWACDELGSLNSFTGKPVEMGGTDYDREGIAGLGVAVAAKNVLEIKKSSSQGATFAVQGIGAMGGAVIRYFSEYGGQLSYVSDPKLGGTWSFSHRLSVELLKAFTTHNDGVIAKLLAVEGTKVSDDSSEVLYQKVDVLFPCAVEDVITSKNVDRIQARYLIEGANNPTTDEAHEALFRREIVVVPDIIANPGGIIAAFVELTSKITPEENVKSRLKVTQAKELTIERVTKNVHELMRLVIQYQVAADRVGDYLAHRNIFFGIQG